MNSDFNESVIIPINEISLMGELVIPPNPNGIVIFSHGSGSSRFSKRNRAVANHLHDKNFGTLLFDLLTEEEDQNYKNRFDIDLLTERLIATTKWLRQLPETQDVRIGYFGASTGAASALRAAANLTEISAVVSRGGRPDMVEAYELNRVAAPTLLIVGSLDVEVIQLNELAYAQLRCKKKLEIIDGATHLFEEPGKLEKVAELAGNWFEKYLTKVNV